MRAFAHIGKGSPGRKSHRAASSDRIPDNWHEMSIEALMAHFDRNRRAHGAPQTTVEALMLGLCERGAKALSEPVVQRRLSELSDDQVIEVGNRLQRLKPEIARAWTAAEVETLLQAKIRCPIL